MRKLIQNNKQTNDPLKLFPLVLSSKQNIPLYFRDLQKQYQKIIAKIFQRSKCTMTFF